MNSNEVEHKAVNIHIGGVHASRLPTVVRTVLGSCVAACIFDPVATVGGMNHFMLPEGNGDDNSSTRYGTNAMEKLINEVMKLGGQRARLRAKVFGGGHVLNIKSTGIGVAQKNASFVKEFLATENIAIVAQRLGGLNPLQVHFYTDSGKVLIKVVGGEKVGELVQEEERYRVEVVRTATKPAADNITLF